MPPNGLAFSRAALAQDTIERGNRPGRVRGPDGVGCNALLGGPADARVPVVTFKIEFDREHDGRWIAEIPDLAGVMCYGATQVEATAKVQALALRVLAERLEHQEAPGELLNVTFQAA
jgi:predicted RNase H-like HicB family nuclease